MCVSKLTFKEINQQGYKALIDALGVAGTIKFYSS